MYNSNFVKSLACVAVGLARAGEPNTIVGEI